MLAEGPGAVKPGGAHVDASAAIGNARTRARWELRGDDGLRVEEEPAAPDARWALPMKIRSVATLRAFRGLVVLELVGRIERIVPQLELDGPGGLVSLEQRELRTTGELRCGQSLRQV